MIHLNKRESVFTFTVPYIPQTEGVQKVSGFSRGWHKHNSVRLGIRNENGTYPLYLYAYSNGKRWVNRMTWFGAKEGDKVWVRLSMWKYGIAAECMIHHQDEVTGIWELSGEGHSNVKREGWLCPVGYDLGSYFEYDGIKGWWKNMIAYLFPPLNIDYKIEK